MLKSNIDLSLLIKKLKMDQKLLFLSSMYENDYGDRKSFYSFLLFF